MTRAHTWIAGNVSCMALVAVGSMSSDTWVGFSGACLFAYAVEYFVPGRLCPPARLSGSPSDRPKTPQPQPSTTPAGQGVRRAIGQRKPRPPWAAGMPLGPRAGETP